MTACPFVCASNPSTGSFGRTIRPGRDAQRGRAVAVANLVVHEYGARAGDDLPSVSSARR